MPRIVEHDVRRAAACDAVIAIATWRGFAAVTVRAVAQELGTSTSGVTHYVSGRSELITLAIRREVTRRQSELLTATANVTGVAALRAMVDWAVQGEGRTAQRLWLAMLVGAHTDPIVRAELAAFDDWWDTLVTDLLRAEVPAERLQAVVDGVGVLVDGLLIASIQDDQCWPQERRRRVIDDWIEILLRPAAG